MVDAIVSVSTCIFTSAPSPPPPQENGSPNAIPRHSSFRRVDASKVDMDDFMMIFPWHLWQFKWNTENFLWSIHKSQESMSIYWLKWNFTRNVLQKVYMVGWAHRKNFACQRGHGLQPKLKRFWHHLDIFKCCKNSSQATWWENRWRMQNPLGELKAARLANIVQDLQPSFSELCPRESNQIVCVPDPPAWKWEAHTDC